MTTSPTLTHADAPTQADALTVAHLTKTYSSGAGEVPVLRGLSMQLRRGEWVALMGPSGSGKSTFLNCCAGLLRPTTGSITLDGIDMVTASDRTLTDLRRSQLGFVFQQYNLVPALTAAQNASLPHLFAGKRPARDAVLDALGKVGLRERADHRPTQLSGGEQQRVAIARMLLQAPTVVFADEPTGALDSVSGAAVLRQFDELTDAGASILMVTHDPNVASKADRVLFLSDGVIVDEMTGRDATTIGTRIAQLEQEKAGA